MIMDKIDNLDVVDVYTALKKEFPKIEFDIVTDNTDVQRFYLKKLYGQEFVKPVKTSIFFRGNSTINYKEFDKIKSKIWSSFVNNEYVKN